MKHTFDKAGIPVLLEFLINFILQEGNWVGGVKIEHTL